MKKINILDFIKCKHRHSIDSHPACFASGDVIDKRVNRKIPWYNLEELRIGYLDIETDGFNADFNTLLTWSLKERDGVTNYDIITKEDIFSGDLDKRVTSTLLNELSRYKIIITYYGGDYHFDIPFIRTKALHYDFPFPAYRTLYAYDLYNTVKAKLKLSRSSLDAACDYLGIKGKTPIDRGVWRLGKYGDKEALNTILSHNIADVEILEELHKKLEPFRAWSQSSI